MVDLKSIIALATMIFMIGTKLLGLHPMSERDFMTLLNNDGVFLPANVGGLLSVN